jgi:hypothetical protein
MRNSYTAGRLVGADYACEFCVEIDHKQSYKLCMIYYFHILKHGDGTKLSGYISCKLYLVWLCISGNIAQKWTRTLHTYGF